MKMRSKTEGLKKCVSLTLGAVLASSVVLSAPVSAGADEAAPDYGLADNIQDGVILHCFSWKYTDIIEELPKIAKAGFTSVQVSPLQSYTDSAFPWYSVYSAEDIYLCDYDDAVNTRADLENLCAEADKYGIKIIMDVVANHLGIGSIDDAPEELQSEDCWHSEPEITNYGNRSSVTNGALLGMLDLNTSNETVQQYTLAYINDLKSLGVDGIRWDAAKHIALPSEGDNFWKVVTDTGLYNYGEILTGPSDNKKDDYLMSEYTEYMSVTDSGYGDTLLGMFFRTKTNVKDGNWTKKGIEANKLVYWAESHDTYSNGGSGTQYLSQNMIDRAYSVAAARADATSLYFSRPEKKEKDDILFGKKGSENFMLPQVSAVNHFHNAMIGKKDSYAVTDSCVVVTREGGGAVIACVGETGEVTVPNADGYAKPGTYRDEITGNEFVITEETITGTVGDSGIAVVYDSPYITKLYAERIGTDDSFGKLYGGDTIKLRAADVKDTAYSLIGTKNGQTVIEETADFANGDELTISADIPVKTKLTLTVTGKTADGQELVETYDYVVYYAGRVCSENRYERGRITFDNFESDWNDVYAYVYSYDTKGNLVENKAYPGEKMTDIGMDYFMYDIPESFKNIDIDPVEGIRVVFSDGSERTESNYDSSWFETVIPLSPLSYGIYEDGHMRTPVNYGFLLTGDLDFDGEISSSDAMLILRMATGLDMWEGDTDFYYFELYIVTLIADPDRDGEITAADALAVLRSSAGFEADKTIGATLF